MQNISNKFTNFCNESLYIVDMGKHISTWVSNIIVASVEYYTVDRISVVIRRNLKDSLYDLVED